MTEKEMARLKVAERLVGGEITVRDAAKVLKLSTRQVVRIKKGVRTCGPKAVIHGNRARKLKKGANPDYILCTKVTRKLDNGSAFSYKGKYYQLVSCGRVASTIPRSSVTVLTGRRIGIKASYSGKVYQVERLEVRPKVAKEIKIKVKNQRVYKRMAGSHPWKSGYAASLGYDKTDRKTLEGLFNSTLAWNPDNQ